MNGDALFQWLDKICRSQGHGGLTHVASTLGISPSHLSKIRSRRSQFHDPTIRLMSWIMSSRDEDYEHLTLKRTVEYEGMLVRFREDEDGQEVMTWKRTA